jgi:hypothetical protein
MLFSQKPHCIRHQRREIGFVPWMAQPARRGVQRTGPPSLEQHQKAKRSRDRADFKRACEALLASDDSSFLAQS